MPADYRWREKPLNPDGFELDGEIQDKLSISYNELTSSRIKKFSAETLSKYSGTIYLFDREPAYLKRNANKLISVYEKIGNVLSNFEKNNIQETSDQHFVEYVDILSIQSKNLDIMRKINPSFEQECDNKYRDLSSIASECLRKSNKETNLVKQKNLRGMFNHLSGVVIASGYEELLEYSSVTDSIARKDYQNLDNRYENVLWTSSFRECSETLRRHVRNLINTTKEEGKDLDSKLLSDTYSYYVHHANQNFLYFDLFIVQRMANTIKEYNLWKSKGHFSEPLYVEKAYEFEALSAVMSNKLGIKSSEFTYFNPEDFILLAYIEKYEKLGLRELKNEIGEGLMREVLSQAPKATKCLGKIPPENRP